MLNHLRALLLAAALVAVAGCGGKDDKQPTASASSPTPAATTAAPVVTVTPEPAATEAPPVEEASPEPTTAASTPEGKDVCKQTSAKELSALFGVELASAPTNPNIEISRDYKACVFTTADKSSVVTIQYAYPSDPEGEFATVVKGMKASGTPGHDVAGLGNGAYAVDLPNGGGVLIAREGDRIVYASAPGTQAQREELLRSLL